MFTHLRKISLNKFITGLSALQFFQIFRYAVLLLIGIVFAKSGLPIGAIGNYETLMFIASLVTTFWVTGIIKSMLSVYDKKADASPQSTFLFNVFVFTSFMSLLCFVLLRTFGNELSNQLSKDGYIPYFDLLSWYILLSNPGYLIEYILLLKDKPKGIIQYGVGISMAQLVAVTAPIFLNYPLGYSIWGLIIIAIIKLIILGNLLWQHSAIKIDGDFLFTHFKLSFPIILSNLIAGSSEFIDGFIISSQYDSATFAIFRYGAKELPITLLLATTFSNTMIAEVANADNLQNVLITIRQKSLVLIYALFPVTILLILSSHYLYPVIFNVHFSASASVFNAYLLLITSRLVFPQTVLIGLKKTNYLLWISLIEFAMNTTLSLLFVHYWGIIGVAIGTVIAFATEKIIMAAILKFKYNIAPSSYIPTTIITAFTVLTVLSFIYVEIY